MYQNDVLEIVKKYLLRPQRVKHVKIAVIWNVACAQFMYVKF